ncbi:MAG: hypothetical protein KJ749_08670 [Planctomycetes bacterium]|nr:hypothetical protein [Planctomycetota bacterium]
MTRDKRDRERLLLDFHLDRIGDEDREWIEAELLRDAEFRTKSDRLGDALRPLDYFTPATQPTGLADRVLRAIEQRRLAKDVDADASTSRSGLATGEGYQPRLRFRMREILAVAASIALLVAVALPAVGNLRSRVRRTMCASNLGSISRGVALYQQASAGSLPFAGLVREAAWLPGAARSRPLASNSRHVYRLVKLSFAEPKDFVCPADHDGQPMRADELADYDDFAGPNNVSYASLNLAGEHPNTRPPTPIAYMSDANPLFVNGRFDAKVDPSKANSRNHPRAAGQSVLYLDGSVRWLTSPVYGAKRDNLWLAGDRRAYVGIEIPVSDDDAFLIPGCPAEGRAESVRSLQ